MVLKKQREKAKKNVKEISDSGLIFSGKRFPLFARSEKSKMMSILEQHALRIRKSVLFSVKEKKRPVQSGNPRFQSYQVPKIFTIHLRLKCEVERFIRLVLNIIRY